MLTQLTIARLMSVYKVFKQTMHNYMVQLCHCATIYFSLGLLLGKSSLKLIYFEVDMS